MIDHLQFLIGVQRYVEQNPDVAPRVTDHVAAGLRSALDAANQRAVDMEVLVAVLATARYPKANRDKLVAEKLRAWRGKSAMNWDTLIADLDRAPDQLTQSEPKGRGGGAPGGAEKMESGHG